MEQRLRFARLLDGEAMAEVCREFGISRKTGYKIFNRYKQHGLEALTNRSRRPKVGKEVGDRGPLRTASAWSGAATDPLYGDLVAPSRTVKIAGSTRGRAIAGCDP